MGQSRKRNKIAAIVSVLMALLLLAGLLPVTAFAARRTVRVGVFPLGQFQNFDEDGEAYGYNIDFLNKLAQTTHWNYEFIPAENFQEACEMLRSDDVDLVAPVQKKAFLEEEFSYSAYTMATECAAIYVLQDGPHSNLMFEDFASMAQLKFGAVDYASSSFTQAFEDEYSVKNKFTPSSMTYYNNTTELFTALFSGEVDAVVSNIMFSNENLNVLGRFSPMTSYYIMQKGNVELRNELNTAMTALMLNSPSYQTELMAAYFSIFENSEFTYAEQQYVNSMPEVIVGYQVNHEPLSYTDQKTGEFAGISRGILDEIAKKSGFKFRYVPLPATDVTYAYLKAHNINVLCNVEYNDVNASTEVMNLSTPYLDSEKVMVAPSDLEFENESALTLALATGSGSLSKVILEKYPNFTIETYATIEECFAAVHRGEADLLLDNRYVVERLLAKPLYAGLSVIPVQSLTDQMCMSTMIYPDVDTEMNTLLANPLFISVIDKAINQITAKDLSGIIIRNTASSHYELTLFDFAYQYRYLLVVCLMLLMICIWLLVRSHHIETMKNTQLSEKNRQLSTAIGQAERANNAKSQFLARMSHEIRTPLNAVVGMTTLAKAKIEDREKTLEYLEKITMSSRVLLNIINDVLDMSAIESEKLKIGKNPFNFKELLTGLATLYYAQCRDKNITFDMVLSKVTEETLVGDALRVNQILLNFLSNALKFTPEGGTIRLSVTQTSKTKNHVYMRFAVSDTGCGMTKEMQERMFRPFEQESADTALQHGGSGLGLSIAKNLTEMMHGKITVESKKGKGSTFSVDLPFGLCEENVDAVEKFKSIRALIVEDDEEGAEYTSVVLARIGIEHDIASTGEEAVDLLRQAYRVGRGYDVCFVDWRMPGMSGIDVTKKIRELFDQETLIIIVSAYDLSEVEEEARAAGANLFVTKPMFQSTVFNVLMMLSGGKYKRKTAQESNYDFTGHRVLLAEDNMLNREIAVELLHMVKMEVDCAENGQEALEKFSAAPKDTYDLILMDVQMPVMDGHAAAKAIRACSHAQAKTIPIYAMTANAFAEDISAALAAGMDGHIAKPIDTTVLYNTLQKHCE